MSIPTPFSLLHVSSVTLDPSATCGTPYFHHLEDGVYKRHSLSATWVWSGVVCGFSALTGAGSE